MSESPTENTLRAPIARSEVQARYVEAYAHLLAEVTGSGLMNRRYGWYFGRSLVLTALFAACFAGLFWLGTGPIQLLVAVAFGILFTQAAFLGHDAAHRQIFESGKNNEWAARILSTVVVGLSYGWWMNKHGRHHANPNKIGKDGDIAPGVLVFVPADARRRSGLGGWFIARQHWFFFPLLTLAGLDLHINALRAVAGAEVVKHRTVEVVLLGIRLIGFPVLVTLAIGPLWALAFLVVQVAVFGVYMGSSFAPNHKGMPIVPSDLSIDFLRRQTLMSRNISGGIPVAMGMGGLNYQIEHHLFPTMPSANLGRARAIVKPYCEQEGISYSETTLLDSYRIVLSYLQEVGLGHADPFECPLVNQLRIP
ncbi:fatty acid desaturase [Leifsonia sp. AK011]|uniref:fatty acid desaturase family protein n=1 Tax=Leifsonia sp. AK011 TaxID=2723075 RepID=UPI0017E5D363|nr:acyl-CoA desaturase [Leifsonia sp. AK011]NYF10212.1 fatty acid desaturase [Leifsonia sp. AK011]